jgi:hypothetical protein|tara:strand:+ start:152 stop:445 length:294 start_codon:yes stop_codon:yes gene_type:complete
LKQIALEGVHLDKGEPFFSIGFGIRACEESKRIASMIHFPEGDYCSWRWEMPMADVEILLKDCFGQPNEPICKMIDGSLLTGIQLRNLIFNCRIVYQ